MADIVQILDSEGTEDEIHSSSSSSAESNVVKRGSSLSHSALSRRYRDPLQQSHDDGAQGKPSRQDSIRVLVPAPARPWEYQPWRGDTTVDMVLDEFESSDGQLVYKIEFEDGRKEDVSANSVEHPRCIS